MMELISNYEYATIKLILLLTFCCGIQAACDLLTVSQDGKAIDTNSVCTTTYRTAACGTFVRTFNQSDLPPGFPRSNKSVEKPSDINLYVMEKRQNAIMYSALSVIWNSAFSESGRQSCFGYLVTWDCTNYNKTLCSLIQLDQTSTILSNKLQYNFTIPSVYANSTCAVKVYSMPPEGPVKKDHTNAFVGMSVFIPPQRPYTSQDMEPAEWRPYIYYSSFENGTINSKFTLPPPHLNLTKFEFKAVYTIDYNKVVLKKYFDSPTYSKQNPHVDVTFAVKESGCYTMLARVVDENYNDKDKCVCWSYSNGEKTCDTCGSVFINACLNVTTYTSQVMEPAKWQPYITYSSFENGTINSKFTLPPPHLNLTKFEFLVVNATDYKLVIKKYFDSPTYSKQNPHVDVTFSVKESGCYRIVARAVDENYNDKDKCVCWSYSNEEKTCDTCGSVFINACLNVTTPPEEEMTIPAKNTTRTRVTPQVKYSQQSTPFQLDPDAFAGGITGSLLIVALAVLMVCGYRKNARVKELVHKLCCLLCSNRRRPPENRIPPKPPGPSTDASILVPLTMKTVYILYSADHQPHSELVEAFNLFLEVHCHCKVITPSSICKEYKSRVYEWFISKITMADSIIFVNSEGAENLILAYLKETSYNSTPSTTVEDAFLYGIKYLLMNREIRERKVILVSFKGKHCQQYLQAGEIHMLPEQLTNLLWRIHNLNAKSAEVHSKLLPLQIGNVRNLREGANLYSAIEGVKDYEENNPGWFGNKFSNLILPSIDSGYLSRSGYILSSVSTQDLTFSGTTSPNSVFEQPNFPTYLDTSFLISPTEPQGLTDPTQSFHNHISAVNYNESDKTLADTSIDSGNLNEKLSILTINESAFPDLSNPKIDKIKSEIESCDEFSIIPPGPLSRIIDNFSMAFANINEKGELIHQDSQSPNNCNNGAYPELGNEEHINITEMGVIPPETLSNIQVDSISAALSAVNGSPDNWSSTSNAAIAIYQDSQSPNNCNNGAYPELKNEEHINTTKMDVIPPETLSNIQVDSVSTALSAVNEIPDNWSSTSNATIV